MEIPNINKKQILNLLKEGKRMDRRKFLDYREISIEKDISINAEGSCRVKIGETEVIAGVKIDVQEPYSDHEDEGTMIVGMEFSPICGERYESGPPQIDAIEVARVVDRGIRESGFIDWKKLCIKKGEKVWCILIDIYCINDDGNVIDASALASVIALQVAKFPKYDEKKEKIEFGELTKESLPLTENIPFTITFHKLGEGIIVDPNRDEEDTGEARLTFAISKHKKDYIINAMQKGGMTPIPIKEAEEMILQSEKIYEDVYPEISKKIEKLK